MVNLNLCQWLIENWIFAFGGGDNGYDLCITTDKEKSFSFLGSRLNSKII